MSHLNKTFRVNGWKIPKSATSTKNDIALQMVKKG